MERFSHFHRLVGNYLKYVYILAFVTGAIRHLKEINHGIRNSTTEA
jgi:hypothetical protein